MVYLFASLHTGLHKLCVGSRADESDDGNSEP